MPSPTDAQRIVTLDEGAAAPAGYEIVRILATSARHVGPGTNYEFDTVFLRHARDQAELVNPEGWLYKMLSEYLSVWR